MLKNIILFLLLSSTLLLVGCQTSESKKEAEIVSSFSIQTSASPNQMNIVEIQEMHKEDNVGLHASGRTMFHSLRLYYGEYGSLLENYMVIDDIRMGYIDHFEMVWTDDEHVIIKVIPSNNIVENGVVQTFEVESYEFDFLTEKLSK